MKNLFGPWATAIHVDPSLRLSTFWKRRMAMLRPVNRSSPRISPATFWCLASAGALACAVPTLQGAPLLAEEGKPAAKVQADVRKSVNEDSKLREKWKQLDEAQVAEITLRHLHGIVRAAHKYCEKHGSLPPPAVPNPDLPPEKRLSGLVLLLPHFEATTWLKGGVEKEPVFDEEMIKLAKQLHKSIDLTKAWDDPTNLEAARTIVPAFLSPRADPFRDKQGYAVSHFALVRGAGGEDNGAFPEDGGITYEPGPKSISDGSVNTLAVGQIHSQLGPWIAAGPSTSRHVYHPSDDSKVPSFGSRHEGGCYFANGDSYVYFLDLRKTPAVVLRDLAGRSDGTLIDHHKLPRYRTAVEWKASLKQE